MVLKSHWGSWDLSPAPSWHQNLLNKSWRGQAKVIAAAAPLIVHPSGAAAEGMNYSRLLLTPSHGSGWCGSEILLGEGSGMWAGAAEMPAPLPGPQRRGF